MGETFSTGRSNLERKNHAQELENALVSPENIRGILNARGVFSTAHDPKTNADVRVVDEIKLDAAMRDIFSQAQRARMPDYKQRLFVSLPAAFGDEPVVTTEQIKSGEFMAKPYFYVPESPDAVIDVAAIKNAEFHHFINDAIPLMRGEKPMYPTKSGPSSISALEAKVAAILFHPNYGDGFRRDGQLMVRDGRDRKYKKFTGGDFLKQHGIQHTHIRFAEGQRRRGPDELPRSIREAVTAEFPHIVQKGLLDPVRDFKQMTYGRGEVSNQRVERVGVSPSGARMIRGVLHYIGKQFAGQPVRIADISPTLGVVINVSDGAERVTHTFNIVPREGAKGAKSGPLAGAGLTQTQPFSAERIAFPRRSDETLEQYRDRTEKTDRGLAHLLLKVIPKHPELARMLRDKPTYEIASIAQASYLLERDNQIKHFDDFVTLFGIEGARTFLVAAHSDTLRDKIFDFANTTPEENVQSVFEAYGKLINGIDKLDAYLKEQFGTESNAVVNMIAERQLNRATNLLERAHQYKDNPDQLVTLVRAVEADVHLFTDSCRVLRGRGELSLENIQGGVLEVTSGNTISKADAEAIARVQETHYGMKYTEPLLSKLRSGLSQALDSEDSRFYIYRKDGEIITFVRFDNQIGSSDRKKHMCSFMVNPKFEGGALGQALLEVALQKEMEAELPIIAECDPELVKKYQEFGFHVLQTFIEDDISTVRIGLFPPSNFQREAA